MTARRSESGGEQLAQAKRTIGGHETMVLKQQDAEAIYDAQPPRINPRLAAALKEHGRRVSLE
ncbi:MAG: hypothetical protein OXG13_09965 [Gemmatimonadaceae bacterium]|nr:hypothetical protein [Gemmatimonadaceae bacterium]